MNIVPIVCVGNDIPDRRANCIRCLIDMWILLTRQLSFRH